MRDKGGGFIMVGDQFIRKTEQSQKFMHLKPELWHTESISSYISCWIDNKNQKNILETTIIRHSSTWIKCTSFLKDTHGLSRVPPRICVLKPWPPGPQNGSVGGDRVSDEVVRVEWVCEGVCTNQPVLSPNKKGGLGHRHTRAKHVHQDYFPQLSCEQAAGGWPSAREGPLGKPTL